MKIDWKHAFGCEGDKSISIIYYKYGKWRVYDGEYDFSASYQYARCHSAQEVRWWFDKQVAELIEEVMEEMKVKRNKVKIVRIKHVVCEEVKIK
jgi:hypothetical protein